MNRYEFHLSISSEKYLDYYRGLAQHAVVHCTSGQTVQFPASLLRPCPSMDGIHGLRVLTSDADHKQADLRRLNSPD